MVIGYMTIVAALGAGVVWSIGINTPGIAIPIVFFSIATALMGIIVKVGQ